MKTDEYVPKMIPITRANEKPFNTWPPTKYHDNAVNNVKPLVRTVRLSVWFTLMLIRFSSDSRRMIFKFSRMRSNTTIVSFIE